MTEIGRFLDQQRAGTHDSEGVFTLDPAKARAKLRHFQLPSPEYCWLKLVQAAVAWKATELHVTWTRKTVVFELGGGVDFGDITRWPSLFAHPLEIEHPADRHLAMGFMGALNLCKKMEWSYERQGRRWTLRLDPRSLSFEETVANGKPARLTFTTSKPPALEILSARCQFCPIPVSLNGRRTWPTERPKTPHIMESFQGLEGGAGVSVPSLDLATMRRSTIFPGGWIGQETGTWPNRALPRSWVAQCRGVEPTAEVRWRIQSLTQLLCQADGGLSEIILHVDGISLPSIWVELPFPSRVVADQPSLTYDLSGFGVVKNAAYESFLGNLWQSIEMMRCLVRIHKDRIPPLPVEIGEVREGVPRLFGPWLLLETLESESPLQRYRAVPANRLNLWDEVILTTFPGQDGLLKRRIQEASTLKHPSIPALLGQGKVSDVGYTIGPVVTGQSLSQALPKGGFTGELAGKILSLVCRIVVDIHAAGGTCRQRLMPENILLSGKHIFLTDVFGGMPNLRIAELASGPLAKQAAWMSPDEIRGLPRGPAWDQYVLGLLGFYLYTGHHPFPQSDLMAMIRAQMEHRPVDPRELRADTPEAVATALLRAMAKEPAQRFSSVKELLQAIKS